MHLSKGSPLNAWDIAALNGTVVCVCVANVMSDVLHHDYTVRNLLAGCLDSVDWNGGMELWWNGMVELTGRL